MTPAFGNDPLQALLDPGSLASNLFPPNSRYRGIPTATYVAPDGRMLPYLRRRLIPQTSEFMVISQHRVMAGERLDTIATQELADPELFWRICDANGAMRPEDLTATPGATLNIALPPGVNP